MAGMPAVAGVGAGLSGAYAQAVADHRLKEQPVITKDLGTAALKLLQSSLRSLKAPGHDLDVKA